MDPRTAKSPLFVTDGISWLGLIAGPLAWALDEEISYALADWSCHAQRPLLTHLISVAALALIIAGAFLSWRDWRSRGSVGTVQNEPPARARFLSLGGFALCLLFGLAVLFDTVAKFCFDPCQR
jgi:hypothetical protein